MVEQNNIPRQGERRDNLVSNLDRGYTFANFHNNTCELVAHYKTGWRRLVATEDMKLSSDTGKHGLAT